MPTQNTDGSWGRPTNRDYATAVAYTAHMLEWLVTTLPASRLEEPHIVRGIDFLHNTFNSSHYQTYISTMSAREISAAMHAAYVLNTYDQRVFVPADPPPSAEPAKTEKPQNRPAEPATGRLAAVRPESRHAIVDSAFPASLGRTANVTSIAHLSPMSGSTRYLETVSMAIASHLRSHPACISGKTIGRAGARLNTCRG